MFETYSASSVAHGMPFRIRESNESEANYKYKPSDSSKDSVLALREPSLPPAERKVFLGRMGTDEKFSESIPNAWMGSTPGHPFWLLPLQWTSGNVNSGALPESLTGPGALYSMVDMYKHNFHQGQGSKMDEYYAKSPWRGLFEAAAKGNPILPPQSLVILPFWEVYPYSWHRDGEMFRHVCWVLDAEFNAARCKLLLGLSHWKSHSITYWSHTYSYEGDGPSEYSIKHISDPNRNMENKQEQAEELEEKKRGGKKPQKRRR